MFGFAAFDVYLLDFQCEVDYLRSINRMEPTLLFPHYFRLIGIILLIPGLVLGFLFICYDYVLPFLGDSKRPLFAAQGNFTDEVIATLIIIGSLFTVFSRLKNESRITHRVRLNALYWTVLVNCILVLFSIGYIGMLEWLKIKMPRWADFPAFYIGYNLFAIGPIILARFYFLLRKVKSGKTPASLYYLPHIPFNPIGQTIGVLFVLAYILSFIPSAHINATGNTFTLIYAVLFLPSMLFCVWAKEEREHSKATRLRAMQLAYYVNYGLLLIATWLIYGSEYFTVLAFGLSSIQVVFVVIFYSMRYAASRKAAKPTVIHVA